MADLGFLPPIGGDEIEPDPLDLDKYQPPSAAPQPLPVGSYLLRLIYGHVELKAWQRNFNGEWVDCDKMDEGAEERVLGVFPILFQCTEKGYLKATYSVEVIGKIERNPLTKVEIVTDAFKGRSLRFQRVNRAPFSKGPRKGSDMMSDMLYAFGHHGTLNGTTRAERNQSYADAMEACLGRVAKGHVVRRRAVDTGSVNEGGRKIYKEFRNADFDEAGEVEYEGQIYTAYNEIDGFFRWSGAFPETEDEVPF